MSGESALRATPSVNIEEFERRLRATGSLGAAQDDPLAELARLLGAEEPPPAASAEASGVLSEPAPEPARVAPPALAPVAAPAPPPLRAAPRADNSFSRVVNVDFGGHTPAPAPSPEPPPLLVEPPPFLETPVEPPPLLRAPSAARPADEAAPRSKVLPVAALVIIGVVAGAGAWAYRGGVPGLVAKTPPLIMAAAGPTKVQPPSQDTVSSPNDIASMIAKDQTNRGTGNVVSNEEQPVDLNERAKAQAAADARAAAPPANPPTIAAAPLVVVSAPSPTAPSAPASTNTATAPAPIPAADAQSAPLPPVSTSAPASASQAPPARSLVAAAASPSPVAPADSTSITPGGGTVGPTAAPPAPPTPFPEPKRVKTVSVRPDGSFIAAPQQDQTTSASQALEPPTLPFDPPTPVPRPAIDPSSAEPATPKLDLPTKLSGKTTTRVPIAKIDTTAATTGQSPEAPLQAAPTAQESKPKRHEPVHVATAEPPAAAPAPDPAPAAEAAPAPTQEEKPSGPASIFAALGDAARGLTGGGQATSAPAAAPMRTVSAAPQATAQAPVEGGGTYAVQLAAPGSEAEAQTVASRLESKYAAELGGLQPAIHKAALKDKTVYRVRIQRLSRSAAVSLCEKLKAAGGACFLARE